MQKVFVSLAVVLSLNTVLSKAADGQAATNPATAAAIEDVDARRVDQIAEMLPEGRFAMGAPIGDRAAWKTFAEQPAMSGIIALAEKKAAEPVPAMTAEIYAQFSKTGERTKEYIDTRYARHERIALYTLAECIENRGRFLAPLESIIADVCSEPTWVFNFHDIKLDGWNGKATWIDLGAVLPASDMSQSLALLGDKLSQPTQTLIIDNCRRRIIDPYRRMVKNEPKSWAYAAMNWNAVCHAGVVTTALGMLDDRHDRAYFVAMAEKLSNNYLSGFGGDGYCVEGLGYWNYGFGNFAAMSELILQATKGGVNLFDLPAAKDVAIYPMRMEMQNGLTASFADCALDAKPDANLFNLLNGHYGLGLAERPSDKIPMRLLPTLAYLFPNSGTGRGSNMTPRPPALRDYFQHGGVLVCRPTPGSAGQMSVSFKGGDNDEPHHHDDLGTFVIAVGHHLPILDPGLEVYSARTFNKNRYQSRLINSFGHPVPLVAGQLQREGPDARAKPITADFHDNQDVYSIDLASSYAVPSLKTLTRTFKYDRGGACVLTVDDEVAFTSPQAFGTALITYGQWKRIDDKTILIDTDGDGVRVEIDAHGTAYELASETIDEKTPSGAKPSRVAINFKQPVQSGRVTMTITPVLKTE